MQTFYCSSFSKLSPFKKSLFSNPLHKVLTRNARYGVVVTLNNVRGYEVQGLLAHLNKISTTNSIRSLYLSGSSLMLLRRLGYNIAFVPKGSYLFYTLSLEDFQSFDWPNLKKEFNSRFYMTAVKVCSTFYGFDMFVSKVLPLLKYLSFNKLYPITLSSHIWVSIIRQVQHVLDR